ncbi:type I secretion protein [Cereibacter sphaeroides]|uniref:Hint domain-containing protein n=1 Tax=Cereibacter sphaeroides TaxID=1063 RepID=UPI000F53ABAC|nr:Hint domain-containing protein [Cereibacter sphaeroides]AZB63680.1 type I secretion protein [Cereibacter sphaeroides]AZB68400.1 Hint domain-containing protein [Cereibacter sphaeroides]
MADQIQIGRPPVVACFTPGTLIATVRGEVAVEALAAGDRIVTRDNGLQPLRWISRRRLDHATLAAFPHLKPVLIEKGSLGQDLPDRDMMVSPNHRILVSRDLTALHFDAPEVLVAAKHLVGPRGIREVECSGTTYLHLLFDRHEVVLANGAWTESFQPTARLVNGMGNAQRTELLELFPELRSTEGQAAFAPARPVHVPQRERVLVR